MKAFLMNSIRLKLRFFGNLKIQSKLLLSFVSVFVLSIIIVIFIFYNNWSLSVRMQAVEFSMSYIKQLNENLNSYVNELDRLTAMTFADSRVQHILEMKVRDLPDVELKKDVNYVDNFLFNMYTLKPDIRSITLIGENRSVYVEGERTYTIFDIDPYQYTWYKDALKGSGKIKLYTGLKEESFIGQVRGESEKELSIVRKIKDNESNKEVGCIRIDIPLNKMDNIVKKNNQGSPMKIVIFNSDKKVVFDADNIMSLIKGEDYKKITKEFSKKTEGSIQIEAGSEGKTIIFNSSPYTKWTVMGVISNSDLYIETIKIRNISMLIAGITIVIILLISLLISFRITNPLKKLIKSMKDVQNGNFDVKVKVLYDDEIGEISKNFNIMISKTNQLIEKEYLLELKNKEAELKALQAQINPHFLYNTLESIRMKAIVNKDKEVAEMAKKLSLFYRLNIVRKSEIVFLEEELEHVKHYIDIQNMRFSNRFIFIDEIDEGIKKGKILKLTLQPLIENTIFHGLEPKLGDTVIILRGWREKEELFIELIDNGVGIDKEKLEIIKGALEVPKVDHNLGIGIINVHNRIKLHFGGQYGLRIFSEAGKGTKVVIHLPYITQKDGDNFA